MTPSPDSKPLSPFTSHSHVGRPALDARVRSSRVLRVVEFSARTKRSGTRATTRGRLATWRDVLRGSHVRDTPLRLKWLRHRDRDATPVRLKPFWGPDTRCSRGRKAGTNPRLLLLVENLEDAHKSALPVLHRPNGDAGRFSRRTTRGRQEYRSWRRLGPEVHGPAGSPFGDGNEVSCTLRLQERSRSSSLLLSSTSTRESVPTYNESMD